MKLLVSVLLSTVLSVHSDPLRQSREIAQRRQFISTYTNNVIHENPNYPDQAAESSVKVNFNLNKPDPRQQIYANNPYQQPEFPQVYPTPAPQSQLFNVGYSVSFTNGNPPPKPTLTRKYPRTNSLDDGEIITGTRKRNEEVQVPSINLSPQDYVSAALIGNKKQKVSGIKPKPHYITNYPNSKVLLTQANLSPNTQKYYKALEQAKPQVQNVQELQQKYSWRNLSPGVEIIRSTEVPAPSHKYTRSEQTPQFDHAKALGRSQDFDYSNALDNNNAPQPNTPYFNKVRKSQHQSDKVQQLPIVLGPAGPKLPLDTSLLREQIPIQVDARLVEEAMRNQIALYSKYSQPQEPVQDVNYLQQNYRTIPVQENAEAKPVQVVFQQEQPQNFQDFRPDQNRFQYKIYGEAQPLASAFGGLQDEQSLRQPRFLSDLHTNLRPPPFGTSYQRIRVG